MLSTSVANALSFMKSDDTSETEQFIRMMDKFFACLNVRAISEGVRKLKPNLTPYRSSDDERLKVSMHKSFNNNYYLKFIHYNTQWLEQNCLQYLIDWEKSVAERSDAILTKPHKTRMLLSRETRSGLQLAGKSFNCLKLFQTIHFFLVKPFVEISKYLLEQPGVHYLLSERFSQDPLEDFFGKQRAHGCWCENPTVQQFIKKTQYHLEFRNQQL